MAAERTRLRGRWAAAVTAALLLSGCATSSADEASETTLTTSALGSQTTVTYHALGDVVTRQITENTVYYGASGIRDRADAEAWVAQLTTDYADITGVEQAIEFGEQSLTETVTIRYDEVDTAQLAAVTGATLSDDPEADRTVSLREAVQTLKQSGYIQVE